MRTRTALLLVVLAAALFGAAWYFGLAPAGLTGPVPVASPAALAFPDLAPRLASAARVVIAGKGQTLEIARPAEPADAPWGLAGQGGYPVQQDRLRELLTGLTELRLLEPRTADPALLERLGLGDPASATSTAVLVRVLDGTGQPLAELIIGHRRVAAHGGTSETVYVRRPGENQSWLAEGRLPADADPQLWLNRDITGIPSARVASVVVHRGETVLEFGRDGDKPALKAPAEHPALDEYRLEDVFRGLEALTLTDVKPATQPHGEQIGTAAFTLTDGTVIEVTAFALTRTDPAARDIWTEYAVRGESDEAKKLAARLKGWAYQVGAWKEKAFVPALDDLKAAEPPAPAPAAPAPAPQ